jgi:hypothetical protein
MNHSMLSYEVMFANRVAQDGRDVKFGSLLNRNLSIGYLGASLKHNEQEQIYSSRHPQSITMLVNDNIEVSFRLPFLLKAIEF